MMESTCVLLGGWAMGIDVVREGREEAVVDEYMKSVEQECPHHHRLERVMKSR